MNSGSERRDGRGRGDACVSHDFGLRSLQALRYAADEARARDVPLVPVIAWIPPGGDLAERRHPSPYLRKIWRDAAWQQLWAAFDDGLGGVRADLDVLSERAGEP
jgi:hypothetical protein